MDLFDPQVAAVVRQRIQIQGIVQGVGFRPFVFALAAEHGLSGFVRNDSAGVTIEVEGGALDVERFIEKLSQQSPPLARVDSIAVERIQLAGATEFVIRTSRPGQERLALIAPDVAVCDDCLRELFDPTDRRHRYPFINCTNCGPRFTITRGLPYDRDQTTMRVFPMCPDCRAEYDDPLDRRFHAQPNACPVCGPQVRLVDRDGNVLPGDDPIRTAQALLAGGSLLAVKGLGGYHLACDAMNAEALADLRARKHREAKPFALMVPDLDAALALCVVSPAEAGLLLSRERPIVLLARKPGNGIPDAVAPGCGTLGLMLPYTPLHHLLFAGRPGYTALVMTSGNRSDEPIAFRDADAIDRLGAIADAFLLHDREIHTHCDDSVVAATAARPEPGRIAHFTVRRSRGFAPAPLRLPRRLPAPVLAVGGHLKNTFCLGKERQAFLSAHIGDLENLETMAAFEEGVEHFTRIFDIAPEYIAHDLHPDYLSTKWAAGRSDALIPVQHHHAHIAAVLAEHDLDGPVIGIAADGTGYGPDRTVWGGEFLVADAAGYQRLAHLEPVPLPGGEQAIRQPWRMGAVYLQQAFGDDFTDLDIPFTRRLDLPKWRPLARMIAQGFNSPPTSSLGRLFDAVAALVGVRDEAGYEGQAAVELEAVASPAESKYPFALTESEPVRIDPAPMIRAIVQDLQTGAPVAVISGKFHSTVAGMMRSVCEHIRMQTGIGTVALGGGVFQNRLLLGEVIPLLYAAGFNVYINEKVPPNDGGLAFGQLAVAAARIR